MFKDIKRVGKLWPEGKIKVYWNIAVLMHSCIVYGCFDAVTAELGSWDRV